MNCCEEHAKYENKNERKLSRGEVIELLTEIDHVLRDRNITLELAESTTGFWRKYLDDTIARVEVLLEVFCLENNKTK